MQPLASIAIAVAVGSASIWFVLYALRRFNATTAASFFFGIVTFIGGAALGYPLVFGEERPLNSPFLLGIAAGLVGLGINQLASSARANARAEA